MFEIERNYLDALQASGFAADFSCTGHRECGWPTAGRDWNEINGLSIGAGREVRYFTGSAMGESGRVYVSVALNPRLHFIHILETTEMDAGLVSATGIAAGLERDGRVELSGVFFDTGRASLRSESESALAEVAELLQSQTALRLDVVGHTDTTGDFDANMSLSQARAAAVRRAGNGAPPPIPLKAAPPADAPRDRRSPPRPAAPRPARPPPPTPAVRRARSGASRRLRPRGSRAVQNRRGIVSRACREAMPGRSSRVVRPAATGALRLAPV